MERTIATLTEKELKEIIKEQLLTTPISNGNKWMTTTEVMDLLDIGRTTLHYRVRDGKFHQYKDPSSNRVYYNREEIDAYIESCKVKK